MQRRFSPLPVFRSQLSLIVASFLIGALLAAKANAAQITLAWDYRTSGASGFALYCGPSSGNYTTRIDVGNTETYTISTLPTGAAAFCTVTAYDSAKVESSYSDELCIYVPTTVTSATNVGGCGLVAAYGFSEGSGTTIRDASGNNNNGTLSAGVTWIAQGKSGSALMFHGAGGTVTIPDSETLHLTSGFTLEAWVFPVSVSAAWQDIIYKGNDNYYLEATSTNAGVPGAGGTLGKVFGLAPLAPNTWTHLALTADSSALMLYVNGVRVSTAPQTSNIVASTNPLQIGGDTIYGQYFEGIIDEVRVYNRPLSQPEIKLDMNTPVQGTSIATPAPVPAPTMH